MTGRDIRVLLVDDQELVRRGFAALLSNEPGIEVVAEAADGSSAIAETWRTRPDVVLMDIRMPGMDGLDATRAICGDDRLSATKVLVLTTFALDEYVYEALRAGAWGSCSRTHRHGCCSKRSPPSPMGTSSSHR